MAKQPISAFLLAWKGNWLARTRIMNMRNAINFKDSDLSGLAVYFYYVYKAFFPLQPYREH